MPVGAGTYGGVSINSIQALHANTIINVGTGRGIPNKGIIIALMVAMQESTLGMARSTTGAPQDNDSGGLFQQRPSAGWGTYQQVRDPIYATNKFYDAMLKIPAWQTSPNTTVAQAVQRSAFPLAYARWEAMAIALAQGQGGTGTTTGGGDFPALPAIDTTGLNRITDPTLWKRIGFFILGAVLLVIALFKLTGDNQMSQTTKSALKFAVTRKVGL